MIKKIIHVGTNYDAYESVVKLYECLLENYDDFTALLER